MRPSAVALVALVLLGASDPAPTLQTCMGVAADAERLACYDRVVGRPASAAAPAAAPADPAATFGKPAAAPKEATRIEARIVGPFKSWEAGTLVKLDNGQVWKVSPEERGYYPSVPDNAEIAIEKSFFGAYWLEIKAINRRIKVRRVS